jgi:hypothetical protein
MLFLPECRPGWERSPEQITGAHIGRIRTADANVSDLAGRCVLKLELHDEVFAVGAAAIDLELIEKVLGKAVSVRSSGYGEWIHAHRENDTRLIIWIRPRQERRDDRQR